MIIKKVTLENYLCYYDTKEFELSNGLNIVLGENGEGKTKLFEAIDWLFNGDNRNLETLVSSKAIAEAEIGDQFRVKVSTTVEHFGDKKTITKSFLVKKLSVDDFSVSNYMIEGVEENNAGERSIVDGQALLDRIFPFEIRKYSMFKGESELNIFDDEETLSNLINSFSRARYYEKYVKKGAYLSNEAEKAVESSTKLNAQNQKKYEQLVADIKLLQYKKTNLLIDLNSTEDQIYLVQILL